LGVVAPGEKKIIHFLFKTPLLNAPSQQKLDMLVKKNLISSPRTIYPSDIRALAP